MVTAPERRLVTGLHLYHVLTLTAAAALFLGGLLNDLAYGSTYQVQWVNMASWLIAGAMVFTGLALAWSLVEAVLGPGRRRQPLLVLLLLLAMFLLGLLNSFIHARDAWGAMPAGAILSVIVAALALATIWISVARVRLGGIP